MGSKITKRTVDAAQPGKAYWDGELKGFGLRVSAGGVKSYVVKYRHGTAQRWMTIGRHGSPWTPETARRNAQKLLLEIAQGGDPAAERKERKNAESLADFADRYMAEYAVIHKKPSTIREERRALRNHIIPHLGKIPVSELQRRDIARFHSKLSGKPSAANRCLALLSHMLNIAEDWGLRSQSSNPCRRIRRFKENKVERYLSPTEMRRLGRALKVADRASMAPNAVDRLSIGSHTGANHRSICALGI